MALVAIVYMGCQHDPLAPAGNKVPIDTTQVLPNDSVCFNTQILPLFVSNCAQQGCHDATTQAEGYVLNSYTGIKKGIVAGNPSNGKIMKEINEDKMPPSGPLSLAQKTLLNKWILEGAQNRNCSDPCDTNVFSFSGGVKPVINNYCLGCHNSTSASAGIILETHAQVKTQCTSGKLICSIERGASCSAMPKGGTQLSPNCIRLIKKWVAAGSPDN